MSSEEPELVDWSPENSKGMIESIKKRDLHLKKMIINHPSVTKRSMTKSPIHMCLKVIIVDQLFPQINKILSRGEKLPLKESLKLSIIKDNEELNKKKIIESLFGSGSSLKNNMNRDGQPINIFGGVEYIFKTTTKKILGPNLEVEENILNHIIIRGLESKKPLDLIPNMVTAIEMLFHPMKRVDIDKIIEESEIEITKGALQKIIDKDFQFEVARRLKSMRFPSIMDRIRDLHAYVEGSGSGAGAGASAGPGGRSKKSKSKKGKSNKSNSKGKSNKGKGNKSKGNKGKGNKSKGNKSKGNKSKGNKSKGKRNNSKSKKNRK